MGEERVKSKARVELRASRLSVLCTSKQLKISDISGADKGAYSLTHESCLRIFHPSLFRGVKCVAATDLVVFINCKKKKNYKKRNGETAVCTVPRLVAEECSFTCRFPGTDHDTV